MLKETIDKRIFEFFQNMESLGISEKSIQRMRDHLKVLDVKSKENLINPGQVCKNLYFVVKGGFVCRYVHQKTGVAKTINFYLDDLHPIMACLDSYFTQTPTGCELKAISNSWVLSLPKLVIDSLANDDNNFLSYQSEIIRTAMTEENELKANLISFSAQEKYEFVMDKMPSVVQCVPSKYIAEFCGISPEWLSKLKRLQ
ncbi:MAG: hypothetical protein AAGC47_10405 [Bacteroidota bacterium]